MICRSCKGSGEHHLDTHLICVQCSGTGIHKDPADDGPEVEIIRRLRGK